MLFWLIIISCTESFVSAVPKKEGRRELQPQVIKKKKKSSKKARPVVRRREDNVTSVIRILALKASSFLGSSIKSDIVSPVKATSGDNAVSVI